MASRVIRQAFLVSFLILAAVIPVLSQEVTPLDSFNVDRLQLTRNGMLVLGTWAVGNFAVSGYGWSQAEGRQQSFHQMNVLWNTVNFGLAAVGYWQATSGADGLSLAETWKEQRALEHILLFNAGLDVGYMATGLYLRERGTRRESTRLQGFGDALLVQGGFLFLFDLGFYAVQCSHSKVLFNFLDGTASLTPHGLGVALHF